MTMIRWFGALIDRFNGLLWQILIWLTLVMTFISAGNAVIRKSFGMSSNAWLEIQWYLFAAVFMLGGAGLMLKNGHVRIDFLASRLSNRTNAIIDIIGYLLFVVPLCAMVVYLGWPFLVASYQTGEMSSNVGGLIRWPVMALIPAGFSLLLLQTLSEVIKRIDFLAGHRPSPFSDEALADAPRTDPQDTVPSSTGSR